VVALRSECQWTGARMLCCALVVVAEATLPSRQWCLCVQWSIRRGRPSTSCSHCWCESSSLWRTKKTFKAWKVLVFIARWHAFARPTYTYAVVLCLSVRLSRSYRPILSKRINICSFFHHRRIRNRTQAFEWYPFQRPWQTDRRTDGKHRQTRRS